VAVRCSNRVDRVVRGLYCVAVLRGRTAWSRRVSYCAVALRGRTAWSRRVSYCAVALLVVLRRRTAPPHYAASRRQHLATTSGRPQASAALPQPIARNAALHRAASL